MLSGALSSSLSAGWRLSRFIQRTFNIWVCPPRRSFADKAGCRGDHADNPNATTPSWGMLDQNALTISSVSGMYRTTAICWFWGRDFFYVAHRFRLPRHISKTSWTLAILYNFICFASLFSSRLLSVFVVSNAGFSPGNGPVLARVKWLTPTSLRSVLTLVFDCLQPITPRQRETLASTATRCGMIENVLRAMFLRSAYIDCISSCWCH